MDNKEKIKVLEISGGLSTEGIGIFLLNTFENIDKDTFQMDFALATKYKQYFEDRIIHQNGKVFRTYEIGDGSIGVLKHMINLYKLIRKHKYEVVHSHMDFFNGINMLVSFLGGVPIRISHAHIANNVQVSLKKKLYYGVMKILIRFFSNKKLGCSDEANKFINGKGKIIFNGISLDKFKKKDYQLPQDIKFNENDMNLITVGRIDDQKNPLFIVDIILFLSKIRNDFHFYWIGSGSLLYEVQKKIDKLCLNNKITFLGTRNDVEVFLSKMDAFILPSKYEGFGIVLAEAQAVGLKCFISDNVPQTVNLGLCEVINLNEGAKVWAEKINKYLSGMPDSLDALDLKKVDIKHTILELEKEYQIK